MTDQQLIPDLLTIAGDEEMPQGYRDIALAAANRIEALRSRLSKYEHPEPQA